MSLYTCIFLRDAPQVYVIPKSEILGWHQNACLFLILFSDPIKFAFAIYHQDYKTKKFNTSLLYVDTLLERNQWVHHLVTNIDAFEMQNPIENKEEFPENDDSLVVIEDELQFKTKRTKHIWHDAYIQLRNNNKLYCWMSKKIAKRSSFTVKTFKK